MFISHELRTKAREEFVDITRTIEEDVRSSGLKEGLCVVYVPHTTAAVTINEDADPSVKEDVLRQLKVLVPRDGNYSHGEGNSDAHIKSSLLGVSQIIPIHEGRLVLGTWQGIFFCEFDGPRNRRFYVLLK
ncbi:MAG: secondary thiamine-phosphate synthase enzyme YjbQ [Acetomicrobium sp.]|jgi:secondary thiamine-phosphate synthase enzyme|uniref:secondary thiamine-phosphate synthase enzyme YjbQ n=1 Tax=Acetomicrobium TaxID=49894 RepID=UPI0016944D87|nr:secondary thiamine-phosphate synthase enzyme YjbQ [Acetomicrobium mobile]NLI43297.1 YjbQ family protein [Synergistaceae bacterium]HOB10901.1 secondary thiamine-phosphate synthase enzyme YjbQ [Acetomicrobium sp.]HQA36201.1 secondary thiamine-phosphate synthase enzyme YjbQ [Acetomicrobium sp.]HQC87609.1 secondary thiamine-phosphate synthase enzyme YjbQ [Acetomicrobium sp.]